MNNQKRIIALYGGGLFLLTASLFVVALGIKFPSLTSIFPKPKIQREIHVVTSASGILGDGFYGRYRTGASKCTESITQYEFSALLSQGVKVITTNTLTKTRYDGMTTYYCEGTSYIVEGDKDVLENNPSN